MKLQFILLALGAVVTGGFGQMSMHEPVTNHLKAGDVAPDVVFTKVLSVPGSSKWSPENLTGRLTVLAFYPDTSDNRDSVIQWNAVIDQFAGKSVQFIWMTGEEESTLLPWLSQHPVKGWVFLDPTGDTKKAYGVELPLCVIIGADRRVVGFSWAGPPTATVLNAALEGRITTTPPSRATMKSFLASNLLLLKAEPFRMPRSADFKPDFPPSYTLHVSASQGEDHRNAGGPDFGSLKDYDLKDAMQGLYGVNRIRIYLPASLDNGKRYDFALSLPEPERPERLRDRVRQGIEDYFDITASRETRLLDAYVVTATDRQPPRSKVQSRDQVGFFDSASSLQFETVGGLWRVPRAL